MFRSHSGSSNQSHSRDTVITVEDLTLVLENPDLYNLFHKTHDLESVDLRSLDTPTKQMVFYSNIVNFLYTHAVLLAIAMETKPSKWEGLEDILAPLNDCGLGFEIINTSPIVQTSYFTKVGYFIGQLGLISCFDLHHTILRRGLTPPILVKGVELKARIEPLTPDPWAVHAPSTSDPRLVFVVHDGRLSSPTPVPLTQDNLEDKLTLTEAWYLSSGVNIDAQNKEISVPEWLFDSCKDLLKDEQSSETDLSLFKYIHSKLDKEKGDILQPLPEASELSKTKNVTVRASNPQIGFNYTLKRSSPKTSPKLKRKISQEASRRHTPSPPHPVVMEKKEAKRKYTFTIEILKFIEQRAPLLAALVYLLSPPTSDPLTFDEKTETVEQTIEDFTPAVGKMGGILQSIRSKVTKSSATTLTMKKDTSVESVPKQSEEWQLTYDKVLSHFSTARPMHQYLVARLSPFHSLIPWDDTQDESPDSRKEFRVCLRTLAALPSSCEALGEACSYVMKRLLEKGLVMEAVSFLASEPASRHPEKIGFLSDIILSCAFVSNYQKTSYKDEKRNPLTILSQISNSELASRLTLASLKYWPVGICENLLRYCNNHLPPSSLLSETVKEKLNCMQNYSLIISSCKSPLHSSRSPWKKWYDIAQDSKTRPDYVLRMLLSSRAFDVARQWAAVHNVGPELSQQIEVEYLSYLLEGDANDPIAAQQVSGMLTHYNYMHTYRVHMYVHVCTCIM